MHAIFDFRNRKPNSILNIKVKTHEPRQNNKLLKKIVTLTVKQIRNKPITEKLLLIKQIYRNHMLFLG